MNLAVDGENQSLGLPCGNTVLQALEAAGISLAQMDRAKPSLQMTLTENMTITVTRVREEFETQQVIVPFERQEFRNESLPAGETRLIQAGQNGLNEVTIRHVFEDEIESESSIVSEIVLQQAVPEIMMVGVQSAFAPLAIPGKLAYLAGGNAWIMEGSTSNRRPLVTSGDLDGHIFALSPDGQWLLFTRGSSLPADQQINTLWAVSTGDPSPEPIDLEVANVVHFADWQPGRDYSIAYSTVAPQLAPPGWNANNDLHILTFDNGEPGQITEVLDTNFGGVYPWWGMTFSWSPDGQRLAYSRPDQVGLVDLSGAGLVGLLDITPYNTHSDWAWTPNLAWSSDGQTLYLVSHAAPAGLVAPEDSPDFNLTAFSMADHGTTTLVPQSGMFAYPSVSPLWQDESGTSDDLVAYLQAIFPAQSSSSHYRLMVMNPDGTEPRLLFPAEGQPGLDPQKPVWAPESSGGREYIALTYSGNLWIVDAISGQAQQVTGDSLTTDIDWK